ncbi:glycosyltransferase family 4 protein, partial [Pseudomonas syringae pv. actinidiae]|nr:glycosyltransferase family 4 protein [Pseudomonas syringae pv. actinidiae]
PELRARLGSQARNSVASLLNLDLMLDQYESIFAQTLQDRGTWHGERVQFDPG